jgi:predicted CXXCH cytochrome family protein
VLNDCRHCHPNHHHEQAELLQGVGGEGVHRAMPNAMFGSRLNCRACHAQPGSDFKGAPLVEATAQTCVACHSEDYRSLFDQWVHEIAEYARQAEEAMGSVTARIEQIRSTGGEVPAGVEEAVAEAAHNIALVRSANGIHNKNYALQLLDLAVRSLDEAMAKMAPRGSPR